MTLGLQRERYTEEEGRLFVRRLEEQLAAMPEVAAVGVGSNIHLNPLSTSTVAANVEGFTPPQGQPGFSVDVAGVDPGFFDAMGIPILQGRNFGPEDVADGPPVAIINEAMAQRFWQARDPSGRSFEPTGAISPWSASHAPPRSGRWKNDPGRSSICRSARTTRRSSGSSPALEATPTPCSSTSSAGSMRWIRI